MYSAVTMMWTSLFAFNHSAYEFPLGCVTPVSQRAQCSGNYFIIYDTVLIFENTRLLLYLNKFKMWNSISGYVVMSIWWCWCFWWSPILLLLPCVYWWHHFDLTHSWWSLLVVAGHLFCISTIVVLRNGAFSLQCCWSTMCSHLMI